MVYLRSCKSMWVSHTITHLACLYKPARVIFGSLVLFTVLLTTKLNMLDDE
jgi:hypothetical protein